VNTHLIETFHDSLLDAGYDDKDVRQFEEVLQGMGEHAIRGILSLPFELRQRRLRGFFERGLTVTQLAQTLKQESERNGFDIGYHITARQIPIEKNRLGEAVWRIRGTELDDRDDMHMAYYSLDYKNLFRKKTGKFLYLVRAHVIDAESTHKKDTSNNWGRANELSIIAEVDLALVEKETKDLAEHLN